MRPASGTPNAGIQTTLPRRRVLHLRHMGNALTVRLPRELAEWLEETSRKSGLPRGEIVRRELERARKGGEKPWMRLAGSIKGGPPDVSMRKGYARK